MSLSGSIIALMTELVEPWRSSPFVDFFLQDGSLARTRFRFMSVLRRAPFSRRFFSLSLVLGFNNRNENPSYRLLTLLSSTGGQNGLTLRSPIAGTGRCFRWSGSGVGCGGDRPTDHAFDT